MINRLIESVKERRFYKNTNDIYLLGDRIIAKADFKEDSQNEYKMGIYFQENKIHVPEMYSLIEPLPRELHDIKPEYHKWEKLWFVIMQKIDGEEIVHIKEKNHKEIAIEQFKIEMKKVLDLGMYLPEGFFGKNIIFNSNENKTYLIDFEKCRKGTEVELDSCDYKLKKLKGKFIENWLI